MNTQHKLNSQPPSNIGGLSRKVSTAWVLVALISCRPRSSPRIISQCTVHWLSFLRLQVAHLRKRCPHCERFCDEQIMSDTTTVGISQPSGNPLSTSLSCRDPNLLRYFSCAGIYEGLRVHLIAPEFNLKSSTDLAEGPWLSIASSTSSIPFNSRLPTFFISSSFNEASRKPTANILEPVSPLLPP